MRTLSGKGPLKQKLSARDWQRFAFIACGENESAPKARMAKNVSGSSGMNTARPARKEKRSTHCEEMVCVNEKGKRASGRDWRVIENSNLRVIETNPPLFL